MLDHCDPAVTVYCDNGQRKILDSRLACESENLLTDNISENLVKGEEADVCGSQHSRLGGHVGQRSLKELHPPLDIPLRRS